jgi:hypothetical protein
MNVTGGHWLPKNGIVAHHNGVLAQHRGISVISTAATRAQMLCKQYAWQVGATLAALAVASKAKALLQDCSPGSCWCKVLPAQVAHSQLLTLHIEGGAVQQQVAWCGVVLHVVLHDHPM